MTFSECFEVYWSLGNCGNNTVVGNFWCFVCVRVCVCVGGGGGGGGEAIHDMVFG